MALGATLTAMMALCEPASGPCGGAEVIEITDDELELEQDLAEAEAELEYEASYDEPYIPPEPELRIEKQWDGGMHFSLGLAPMSTLHTQGFHPGVRYDIGTGMAWTRGRARLAIGPEFHILQYYGRKKAGFGVDAMATLSLRHLYVRLGAGTATGIPARRDVADVRPMMGGLVGGGFVGRIHDVEGQIGLDYDVRIDTTGRVAQTVLVAMRLSFGP